MNVLNKALYRFLERKFPGVRVVNQGETARVYYAPDFIHRKGRLKAELSGWGETYFINCPFCNDTRSRLAICHRWAVRDEKTNDDMLQLVKCFNENCLNKRERQKRLHELVFPCGAPLGGSQMEIAKVVEKPRPEMPNFEMPESVRVNKLRPDHPAVQYLKSRSFSARQLGKKWGVSYCYGNCGPRPRFQDERLVYPIVMPRSSLLDASSGRLPCRLAGWQARRIDDSDDSRPRYLTAAGMRKTELLYGLAWVISGDGPVAIVEGVTDVWRLRRDAVALFGKTISAAQIKLLCRHFAGRPLVIFLDGDARDEARQIRRQLLTARQERGDDAPVALARAPKGRGDPGECTYDEAWGAVRTSLSR
jgi:hypothetical protein